MKRGKVGIAGAVWALWICTRLWAQSGAPIIRTYTPKDYGGRPKNYSVAQDKRGVMYFGNEDGVLEYDGASWRKIFLPDSNAARVLNVSREGRIFAAGTNECGYLAADTAGRLAFHSLRKNFAAETGGAYDITINPEGVYFAFEKNLLRWDGHTLSVCTKSNTPVTGLQNLLYQPGWGLVRVKERTAFPIKLPPALANQEIKAIVSYNAGVLLAAPDKLWFYDGKEARPFPTKADVYLRNNRITDVKVLSNQSLAISTIRGGLVIVTPNGKVENIINRGAGLPNETVYDLWIDNEGGMWLCTEEGVSRAEIVSPITTFGSSAGLKGGVNDVFVHENTFYVGASTGLYYLNTRQARAVFEPVQGLAANTYKLYAYGRELYAATGAGIYTVKKDTAVLTAFAAARTLAPAFRRNVRLFAGLIEGVGVLTKDPKIRVDRPDFLVAGKNSAKNISYMESDRRGRTWLISDAGLQVMYYKNAKDTLPAIESMAYNASLPRNVMKLFKKSGEVVFATDKGLFRYVDRGNRFVPDSTLGPEWILKPIEYIYQSPKHDFLLVINAEGLWRGLYDKKKNAYQWEHLPYRQLKGAQVATMFNTGADKIIWIGYERGLFRLDPTIRRQEKKTDFATLMRSVAVTRVVDDKPLVNLLFDGTFMRAAIVTAEQDTASMERSHLKNNFDKIRFDFSAACFDGETGAALFQYRLVGGKKNDEWRKEWTNETFVELNNQGPGTYTFEVRAQNASGEIGKTAAYTFVVEPLWYETRTALAGFILAGVLVVAGVSWGAVAYSTRAQRKKIEWLNREIKKATGEIERLLHNILPSEIAEQLRKKQKRDEEKDQERKRRLALPNALRFGQTRGEQDDAIQLLELAEDADIIANDFVHASVLFTDFKGFTIVAEKMSPEELIRELNTCFIAFDEIIDGFGLEKIKTIGDAYMCAGGVPKEDPLNHVKIVLAAMGIQKFMWDLAARKKSQNKPFWELRLGIHVGPLVAGVVGKKKFAYDIWGDTVNTASRMESSGEPGRINISGELYALVKDLFVCSYRGKIAAKNKGDIEMYFVEGIKPELCSDAAGRDPNALFWEYAQNTAIAAGKGGLFAAR